jgi:hypothetical protein
MNGDSIQLWFTPQQLDYIANTLAARPYGEVQALLADIGRQVAQQNDARTASPVKSNGIAPEVAQSIVQ